MFSRGETRIMIASRGLVATAVLFTVFFYSFNAIIVGPLQERSFTATRDMRSLDLPSFLSPKSEVLSILLVSVAPLHMFTTKIDLFGYSKALS